MKPEIIEALAIELTKAAIADKDRIAYDKTSADLWVQTYLESEKQIKEAAAKANPPVVGTIDLKGW